MRAFHLDGRSNPGVLHFPKLVSQLQHFTDYSENILNRVSLKFYYEFIATHFKVLSLSFQKQIQIMLNGCRRPINYPEGEKETVSRDKRI